MSKLICQDIHTAWRILRITFHWYHIGMVLWLNMGQHFSKFGTLSTPLLLGREGGESWTILKFFTHKCFGCFLWSIVSWQLMIWKPRRHFPTDFFALIWFKAYTLKAYMNLARHFIHLLRIRLVWGLCAICMFHSIILCSYFVTWRLTPYPHMVK